MSKAMTSRNFLSVAKKHCHNETFVNYYLPESNDNSTFVTDRTIGGYLAEALSQVVSLPGPQGAPGAQGPQGEAGEDGSSLISVGPVSLIGTPNGLIIKDGSIAASVADQTYPGLVSTGLQAFNGPKICVGSDIPAVVSLSVQPSQITDSALTLQYELTVYTTLGTFSTITVPYSRLQGNQYLISWSYAVDRSYYLSHQLKRIFLDKNNVSVISSATDYDANIFTDTIPDDNGSVPYSEETDNNRLSAFMVKNGRADLLKGANIEGNVDVKDAVTFHNALITNKKTFTCALSAHLVGSSTQSSVPLNATIDITLSTSCNSLLLHAAQFTTPMPNIDNADTDYVYCDFPSDLGNITETWGNVWFRLSQDSEALTSCIWYTSQKIGGGYELRLCLSSGVFYKSNTVSTKSFTSSIMLQ